MDDVRESDQPGDDGPLTSKCLSRREFLKVAGIAGATIAVGAGLGGFLAACGEGGETTTTGGGVTTTAGGVTTTAGGVTTTAGGAAKDKIRIGYVDADTGIYAPGPLLFQSIWLDTLVADYNANGGLSVDGKKVPIEVVKYDSASDTETLIRLTEKCMTEDKVDLMFAPWGTSQNFAVYPLYEKHEYPFIPSAMGSGQIVELIQGGGATWAFPVICQPPFGAKYTADFLEQAAKPTKIGIIGINDLHGIEWTGRVQSELAARNMPAVVGPELYPLTVADLSPIIKKLQEAQVDCLWASTYPADGVLLVKQCMELKFSPRIMFMGPGSQYPLIMLPAFGAAAMTGIMEYHGFEVDFETSPDLLALAGKYKTVAGGTPGPNTIASYVCNQCQFEAVEKVGLDRTKVRDTLKTDTFDTVVGPAKWNWTDVYLDTAKAGFLTQWQGGEYLKTIWPPDRASAPWIPKPAWP